MTISIVSWTIVLPNIIVNSVEYIEVILEGIDDELNSKQRSVSDVSPYLQTTVPGADPGYNLNWVSPLNHFLEFDQLTMEDQLKFKIAASFLIQLQNREAKTLLDIMERRNELDLWAKINMYNLPRVSNECSISVRLLTLRMKINIFLMNL